ncbi:hypothetical protein M501DRAFT_248976 [Patellaria atrata CBS 101060]|uniref:Peptidase S33 tripeptidyl aminopeptidase-like C-terminal domain-containing protein n=1 Tax=Patellaria atrata CBS 101060 TaxID=1346257 RepID=A0A9P4VNT5_9PEZI|nr:hypothetical protein M501DRAFT_248976 [Patellaria atrata CBS 101060]
MKSTLLSAEKACETCSLKSRRASFTSSQFFLVLYWLFLAFSCFLVVSLTHFIPSSVASALFFWRTSSSTYGQKNISNSTANQFDWSTIQPSRYLHFKPCYDDLQCARLEVPLDYWNGTDPDITVTIAIAKLPARVSVTDPRYGGPILIHPGGPGGSGVTSVVKEGKEVQSVVDSLEDPTSVQSKSSAGKYFDIIGFDQRGVGKSSPGAHCFNNRPTREAWALRTVSEGILNSSDAALGRLWAMNDAFGKSCAGNIKQGHEIKQHISTPYVARDMVEIIEKFGEWRHSKALSILSKAVQPQWYHRRCRLPTIHIPQRLAYRPGKERLQYWGFSYGTFLGSTFASMFPDRVERIVLDGVVHPTNNYLWTGNLLDTEKAMEAFYNSCAAAGPGLCALATNGSTSVEIQEKVQSILDSLYHDPLPVPGTDPEIITWTDVKVAIFHSLYTPIDSFPILADIFAQIERRDAHAFASSLSRKHSYACTAANGTTDLAQQDGEALFAIECSDADPQNSMTQKQFDRVWRAQNELSPSIGQIWSELQMVCTGWTIRPKFPFPGLGAKTLTPLLLVGNTADPVTPLVGAHKMSSLFPDSVILTQDSPGHTSTIAFSHCTTTALRAYFHNATLPVKGTVCGVQEHPFGVPLGAHEDHGRLEEMEVASMKAVQGMRKVFGKSGWGLGRGVRGRFEELGMNHEL